MLSLKFQLALPRMVRHKKEGQVDLTETPETLEMPESTIRPT